MRLLFGLIGAVTAITNCHDGYHLEGNECKKKVCTQCANGIAGDDAYCTGTTGCSACEFGYHLWGNKTLYHQIDGKDVYLNLQCKQNTCPRKLTATAMACNARETFVESQKYDRNSDSKGHGFLDLDPWREGSNSADYFTVEKLCETNMRWLPDCPLSTSQVPNCQACDHLPVHKVKCSDTLGGVATKQFNTMCHAACGGYLYNCVPVSMYGPEGSRRHGPDLRPAHKMPMTHMLDDHIAAGAMECDAIRCNHTTRRVWGMLTSSIMVRHVCIKGSDVTAGKAKDYVPGFEHLYGSDLMPKQFNNLGFGHNKQKGSAGTYDRDACLEEKTCEYGHYCGMNSDGGCKCVQNMV